MKRACILAVLLLPWGAHAETAPAVAIVELLPDPGPAPAREFIELWSQDGADLATWRIEDAAGNAFVLDGHTIAPGGRLVVWGGGEATAEGPAWSKAAVWNNGGDTAFLYHGDVLVDSFSYGSAGGPSAPATGNSLAWDGATWVEGEPSPGAGPQASASVTVQDVPPDVAFVDLPARVDAGATVPVQWTVHDPNGDETITAWRLWGGDMLLANGAAAGAFQESFTAPDSGPWTLRLEADDAVQTATVHASIQVDSGALRVVLPAGGIRFPDIAPGAANVLASASFMVHNDADTAVSASIDIADFHGPESFSPVGRLSLLIGDGEVAYDGPFTVLGEVPAGGSMEVLLRIDQVPLPLAAGAYGTTFAVVA